MVELLMVFAFWPWVLVFAFLGCLAISTRSETTSVAVVGAVIFIAISWFAYGTNPFVWIHQNPGTAITAIILYSAIGALWSLFKWWKRVTSPELQKAMADAKKQHEEESPDCGPKDYMNSFRFPDKAKVSANKDRIVSWIALWPLSMIGFLVGDVLLEFFNRIYDWLASIYERVTTHYAP